MIKKTVVMLSILLLFNFIQPNITYSISVPANSAILIEEKTGRILYEKNIKQKLPMASTTKIMTAIVALEYGELDEVVKVPLEAVGVEGSSIYIKEGDKITLEHLIYGLMLRSGNDAAYAIAIAVAGSIENFVELMNQKAKIIGALDTNFKNPHGLHHEEHYTTAEDLAKITQYAFKNEKFKEISATTKKEISINNQKQVIYNKNKLLTGYEGANGVKTGYTMAAGKCLVFSAYRDGLQVIGVLLGASNIWTESRLLLDYGFENYTMKSMLEEGEYLSSVYVENGINDTIKIVSDERVDIPIKEGENIRRELNFKNLKAPIYDKEKIGTIDFYIGEDLVYEKVIYSPYKIYEKDFKKFLIENFYDFFYLGKLGENMDEAIKLFLEEL